MGAGSFDKKYLTISVGKESGLHHIRCLESDSQAIAGVFFNLGRVAKLISGHNYTTQNMIFSVRYTKYEHYTKYH